MNRFVRVLLISFLFCLSWAIRDPAGAAASSALTNVFTLDTRTAPVAHVGLALTNAFTVDTRTTPAAHAGFALTNVFTLDTRTDQMAHLGFGLTNVFTVDTRTTSVAHLGFALTNVFALDTRTGTPTVVAQRGEGTGATSGYRQLPDKSVLLSPVPNPFNLGTTIAYGVSQSGRVRLGIYDLSGREVTVLRDEAGDPGYASVQWNGQDRYGAEVASGVYVVTLEAGGVRSSKKLLLLR